MTRRQTDPTTTTTQEDPMTTDPTAKHHAQILDWLSAALTDPDTDEIRLEQGVAGQWDVYVEKSVDPAKEVAALSAYDEAFLAKENVVATPEGDVPEKDVKGRPEKEDPQPYNFGGIRRDGYTGCTCPDCLEMEEKYGIPRAGRTEALDRLQEKALKAVTDAISKRVDEVLKPTTTEVPPAFTPSADDGKVTADYLRQKYGQAAPDEWWKRAGFLDEDSKVTNDSAGPVDWEAVLSSGRWTTTDYGARLEATFSGKAAEDLLLALYGFAGEDEKGVAYHADTPESVQKAKDDLFRPEDES